MKRFLSLLTVIAVIGITNVWAEQISFNPGTDKGKITANGTSSGDSFQKEGFTVTSSNGVLGNGSNYRVYTGGTFSISSTVGTINSVSLTFSGSSNTGGLSTSYTNLSTTEWSVNATSQARITAITVTYTPAVSCDKSLSITKVVSGNGSFFRYHLKIFHHIIMSMFASRLL